MTAQSYTATILMRNNQITELVAEAFKGTDHNVARLDFSDNKISTVNFSTFDTFTQLQVRETTVHRHFRRFIF